MGAESLGLYQITLSVVGVLVTLTASGIPITVSRLMMKAKAIKDKKAENQVISAGIFTSLILSLPLTILLYLLRSKLTFIFTDQRCYDILLVILPSIVLTSVYSVIRGSFWGNKKFFTYSLIELIEEISMLVFGVFLVSKMHSPTDGALKAGYAIFISYVISFLLSTTVFIHQGGKLANPFKQLPPLLESSIPITVTRTATSLISTLIAIILPARLIAFGATNTQALSLYGELSGMAFPLLFIPSTLIGSIALVLVPELSENFYKKQFKLLEDKISNAIKCSILIACFICPIFIICGEEIGLLIYSNSNAGKMLSLSSIIMPPMCITLITTSILNSLNQEKKTLLIYFIGAGLMLTCVWFLPKICSVNALIWGHLASYLITAFLNLVLLEKLFYKNLCYKKQVAFCLFSALISTLFGWQLKNIFHFKIHGIWLILSITLFVLIYNFIVMKVLSVFDIFNEKK